MGVILGAVLACYPFAGLSGVIAHAKQRAYARARENSFLRNRLFGLFLRFLRTAKIRARSVEGNLVWTPFGLQMDSREEPLWSVGSVTL